jgi:DNA-binding CsgD family transcriptional regulator
VIVADDHPLARRLVRGAQIPGLLAAGLTTEGISAELRLAIETERTHIKGILRKLRVHRKPAASARAAAAGHRYA